MNFENCEKTTAATLAARGEPTPDAVIITANSEHPTADLYRTIKAIDAVITPEYRYWLNQSALLVEQVKQIVSQYVDEDGLPMPAVRGTNGEVVAQEPLACFGRMPNSPNVKCGECSCAMSHQSDGTPMGQTEVMTPTLPSKQVFPGCEGMTADLVRGTKGREIDNSCMVMAEFCKLFAIPPAPTVGLGDALYAQIPYVLDLVKKGVMQHFTDGVEPTFEPEPLVTHPSTPEPPAPTPAAPQPPAPTPAAPAPAAPQPPAPTGERATPQPPAPPEATATPAQPEAPAVPATPTAPEPAKAATADVGFLGADPGTEDWVKAKWPYPTEAEPYGPQHYFFPDTTQEQERELAAMIVAMQLTQTSIKGFKNRCGGSYKELRKKLIMKAKKEGITDGSTQASRVLMDMWPSVVPLPDGYFDAEPTPAAPAQPATPAAPEPAAPEPAAPATPAAPEPAAPEPAAPEPAAPEPAAPEPAAPTAPVDVMPYDNKPEPVSDVPANTDGLMTEETALELIAAIKELTETLKGKPAKKQTTKKPAPKDKPAGKLHVPSGGSSKGGKVGKKSTSKKAGSKPKPKPDKHGILPATAPGWVPGKGGNKPKGCKLLRNSPKAGYKVIEYADGRKKYYKPAK